MDFIPIDYTAGRFYTLSIWTTVVGAIFGVALIIAAIYVIRKKDNPTSTLMLVGGVLLLVMVGSIQITPHTPDSGLAASARVAQRPEIQKSIEQTYGITVSSDQIRKLKYPRVKPTENFKVFGYFEDRKQIEGAKFETRRIYLVWADDKLNLSQSTDGESFTPLSVKKQS